MNGAELRAWRERLGKDEAWIEGVLDNVKVGMWPVGYGAEVANGSLRRRICEGAELFPYSRDDVAAYRTAYHAALEDEERAQAKRGPVEPVCPEGVTRGDMLDPDDGSPNMMGDLGLGWQVHVSDSGRIRLVDSGSASPALLEYAAALSRHRASVHADSDKRRKLDAVRAAEAAQAKAIRAERDAVNAAMEAARGEREATTAREVADRAVDAARREAGL